MNSNNITFSILMANYNNAKYIEEAIMSVFSQTYSKWELIIVDDCSTDNSIEIIKKYLHDKRVKFLSQRKNIGYGGTLRTCAKNASNTIIGIVDADDKLHKKALEIMAEAYRKNPDYGVIYSTMWKCNSDLKIQEIAEWIGHIIPPKSNIFIKRISHLLTFRREIYKKTVGFDNNQKRSVDTDIIFKLEEVSNFKYINQPLYYYRQHEKGISQGNSLFVVRVYHYIASCKAYRRRLNTKIPNLSLTELYLEYFNITFHKLNKVFYNLIKSFKISKLIKGLNLNLSFLSKKKHLFFINKLKTFIIHKLL
ncbi:hypothetical protein LCGC14_1360130 [marine sediment metagenome]|uniref:Glycosyltransferase 2-like domain-containing protein n=1 Tax=marine sediment metagenome TaxID=412755 RepID=A0A0F9K8Y9_9ZZZZ